MILIFKATLPRLPNFKSKLIEFQYPKYSRDWIVYIENVLNFPTDFNLAIKLRFVAYFADSSFYTSRRVGFSTSAAEGVITDILSG